MKPFPKSARVAFIGDSITHTNNYTSRIIAQYRYDFSNSGIAFRNCGISGGSAGSAVLNFAEDIAPFAPTHATVMLGVNDSCRHALNFADETEKQRTLDEAFQQYEAKMRALCDLLAALGTQILLCTPVPYAEFQHTAQEALPGGEALIAKYAASVRNLAAERGYALVDFHAAFLDAYRTDPLYGDDHVHPTDFGHYRMAKTFLATQGMSIAPFEALDAVRKQSNLADWAETVGHIRDIYATEWMIVHQPEATVDEKLAIAQHYVDTRGWGDFAYFERLAKDYLIYKPKQAELERHATVTV